MKPITSADQWPAAMLEQMRSHVRDGGITLKGELALGEAYAQLAEVSDTPDTYREVLSQFLESEGVAEVLAETRGLPGTTLANNARGGLGDVLQEFVASGHRHLARRYIEARTEPRLATRQDLLARREALRALLRTPDARILLDYIQRKAKGRSQGILLYGPNHGAKDNVWLCEGAKLRTKPRNWIGLTLEQIRYVPIEKIRSRIAELVAQLGRGERVYVTKGF